MKKNNSRRANYIAALDKLEEAIRYREIPTIKKWLKIVEEKEAAVQLNYNDAISMRTDNLINQANDIVNP